MNTQDAALYRMLTLRPASYPGRDGVQVAGEAVSDVQFLRDIVKTLLGELHAGHHDDADLGRRFRERIFAYAESCPRYEDELATEEMDDRARRFGVGA